MRVVAESNLRWVSGVDLSHGAGDMFLQEGNAALQFDFNDPQRLEITGIALSPTMDMRIAIQEHPSAVPSCTDPVGAPNPACKSNYPPPMGNPVPGSVWTVEPWVLEHIIARAGLHRYGNRVFPVPADPDPIQCYFTFNMQCNLGTTIGKGGDPPGWMEFVHSGFFQDIDVPDPQFLWELLNEVAQVGLHDPDGDGFPDIPEGQAQPVYPLYGVPIGLTGQEIVDQMRPTLQSQAAEISDAILGRFWVNNDAIDFYYRRADPAGEPYLYFVAESDLRADPDDPGTMKPYTYARPGFFMDPDLSEKVSKTDIPGIDDTEHEKYQLPPGETILYMQDDEDVVYEVRFFVPESGDPQEIVAQVSRL
jgi:hypothetical protein